MSADVKVVRMLLANGTIAQYPVADIIALEFTPRTAPPAPAPDPAKKPAPVTVPAKTILNVLLTEAIDVDVAKSGMTFKSLLDDPVMLDGRVDHSAQHGGRASGGDGSAGRRDEGRRQDHAEGKLAVVRRSKYEIVTAYVEQKGAGEGKKTGRKVIGGAGLGAIVGGIAGGGSGAAIGAAVGGATGAVVASQGTEHLQLPAETRLQFQLTSAVTVQP